MEWNTVAEIDATTADPLEEILKARNITDKERFLHPSLSHLYLPEYDPFLLKDMDVAIPRISEAIDKEELILIAGDYDADGVTSTSVLVMGLEELGADVDYDIPNRKDGYGLSKEMVQDAYDNGVSLIVTCDNGIAAVEAVAYANKLGLDVIVTDHHEPQEELPKAFAVVDPKRHDCPYPTKELAGCGVALKVLQALNSYRNGDMRKTEKYLDIVTIGTVADVMSLVGENRIIVKYGLARLAHTENKGLRALLKLIRLGDKDELTTKDIGWSIGPVLNAIGRLYHAGEAVEMLITPSKRHAYRAAKRLESVNTERKKLTEKWVKKITDYIDGDKDLMAQSVMLVPYEEDVPEGIVGLIAGKLKDRYARPIVLMTTDHKDPSKFKGSGRSVGAYNMFDEMTKHKHLLTSFGGHHAACGISLYKKDVPELRELLNDGVVFVEETGGPSLEIDYELEPEMVTEEFVDMIALMEPFGKGNEKPLFLLRDVFVQYPKAIGAKANHLKFVGQANDENIDMIGWSMYKKYEELGKPRALDIAFHPGINEWNGKRNVQLEMQDIRESEE